MGRHANPLTNPLHYASKQLHMGPPVSYATAQRTLTGYDYVIVGAGAAGCVLASKLSEDKDVSVLVLEAGGNNNVFETKVPILFSKLFHSKHDWDYKTVEQTNVANRQLYWPRGRILGGSSSMNAMIYHHCSKSDFDEWASDYGCKGWGHEDLAPYFRRMENHTTNPNRPAIDPKHRGTTGEWHTGYSHLSEIMDKGFIASCEEVGIPANPDLNTPNDPIGVTRFQTFIDPKGQRSSLATAYLPASVQQRPNLYIACGAHVTKVLYDHIDRDGPRAIGVEFQTARGGDKYQVHAKREVIMSAGSVNTPQILKLSGIGPQEELEKHKIPVVKANDNVGTNLKDHLCCTGILCKAKPGTTMDYLTDDVKAIPALLRWLLTGSGPLTSNVGEAAAFVRSVDYKFGSTTAENTPKDNGSGGTGPDIELIAAPMAYIHHGEEKAPDGCNIFSIVPVGIRPKSSGTVTIQSRDPFDHPLIDPKYLSDENDNDRKVLLTGLRVTLQIIQSEAFKKYLEPVEPNDDYTSYWWPYSSRDYDSITDDELMGFMTEIAFTLYHPVGTARMGPSPESSVVDIDCNVHGVKGLRVMDASVFPDQISGHPTAAIAAMAYKLSDTIKARYAYA